MTFSQHAAQSKTALRYYLGLFVVTVPMLYLFMIWWLGRQLETGPVYTILVTICSLSLLFVAIVPEVEGSKNESIHRFAAFLMSALMLPIILTIFLSEGVSGAGRVMSVIAAAYMVFSIFYLSKHQRRHEKILWIQASYVAVFHLTILAATYLS